MRERPIIMSAPAVRAILAGTKTQTRRVVKLPANARDVQYYAPPGGVPLAGWADPGINYWTHDGDQFDDATGMPVLTNHIDPCPYGVPGDRLWVRETWRVMGESPEDTLDMFSRDDIQYRADRDESYIDKYRSPVHMPRDRSRITLEITGVRVERLQNISEDDAVAEGVVEHETLTPGRRVCNVDGGRMFASGPIPVYRDLWESINGPGSWDANPWVWVVAFRRVA